MRAWAITLGLAGLALLVSACDGGSGAKSAATSPVAALSPCDPSPDRSQAPTTIAQQADVLLAEGDPDSATTLYDKVLADPRARPADKLCAARGLAAIAAQPAPPKTAQQRVATGWNAAYKKELKPLQDVVVPILVVLAVLLGLSRFGTPVFVGPATPGARSDGRSTRAGLAGAYWLGVAAQVGAAALGVLAVARADAWSSGARLALAVVAVSVIGLCLGCAVVLFTAVGRSRSAPARAVALAPVVVVTAGWLLFLALSDHGRGRAWLIGYAIVGAALGITLAARVRGIQNRVWIEGRTAAGGDDAAAGDRVRLGLQALGSRPAAGLEVPQQTDVDKLPDEAITLLPDGAFAKAVFRVVQMFLPASPWRVTVADLTEDRLGVTVMRNGRTVSATVVHASDLGYPAGAKDAAPRALLDAGAAAFVLALLAKRYAYLNEGLSGATRWKSIAAQAAASDRSLALEPDVKQALIARAIQVDPANAAARLAQCHVAYRHAESAEEALTYARDLTALAENVPQLNITLDHDDVTKTRPAEAGWTALQLRVLYNLAVAWLNHYLLLAADAKLRPAALSAATAAAEATGSRLPASPSTDLTDLVADLRPAVELTGATIRAEGQPTDADRAKVTVKKQTLDGLLAISTTYDRACFYVATRQAEPALRDLALAALDDAVRAWAGTDPSMEWLRTSPVWQRKFWRLIGDPVPDDFVQLPLWKAQADRLTKHGIATAADLHAAPPAWLAGKLGLSTALVARWGEAAAVAMTEEAGAALATGTVFLLFTAGVETRADLRAKMADPAAFVTELAEAAAGFDVDVPPAGKISSWSVLRDPTP